MLMRLFVFFLGFAGYQGGYGVRGRKAERDQPPAINWQIGRPLFRDITVIQLLYHTDWLLLVE